MAREIIRVQNNKAADLLSPVSTPLTLSTSWQDIGPFTIYCGDRHTLGLFLKVTINDSTDLEVRALGSPDAAFADDYDFPFTDSSGSAPVLVQPDSYQLQIDTNQNVILPFPVLDIIPYVRLQARVLAANATPAQITSAKVTTRNIDK
jgi:hypothetical protein